MKRFVLWTAVVALAVGLLSGCRQYPGDPDYSDAPPRQSVNTAPATERGEGR